LFAMPYSWWNPWRCNFNNPSRLFTWSERTSKSHNMGYVFCYKKKIHRLKSISEFLDLESLLLTHCVFSLCFFALAILIALVEHPNFVLTLIWYLFFYCSKNSICPLVLGMILVRTDLDLWNFHMPFKCGVWS